MTSSILPLAYVLYLTLKPTAASEFLNHAEELDVPIQPSPHIQNPTTSTLPQVQTQSTTARTLAPHDLSGHFEEKWFVHSFIATYADTNSVGNVYFGMYAMWVGKTRELFFNRVMPKFNLKTTPFYILTRSFHHKFIRETHEFESVSVKIRIATYNRKFVTLEHQVYDSTKQLLGKGQQTLLFVDSTNYRMIDIPADLYTAFLTYA